MHATNGCNGVLLTNPWLYLQECITILRTLHMIIFRITRYIKTYGIHNQVVDNKPIMTKLDNLKVTIAKYTEDKPWYVLVLIFLGAYIVLSQIRNYILLKKSGAVKAPFHGDWLLGWKYVVQISSCQTAGTLPEFFQERFTERNFKTFRGFLGGRSCINTKDPENIKALLATQFNDFALGTRYKAMNCTLGAGIFTLDGQGWKHSRAMLRPQFARGQVGHVTSLEPHIQALAARVREANGGQFDLQPLFFELTIDSGTEFLFGESCESLRADRSAYLEPGSFDKLKDDFPGAFNHSQTVLFNRVTLQNLYFLNDGFAFRKSNKVVHDFTDFYVKKALDASEDEVEKVSENGYTFLYELAKQTRDPKLLRDQCLNILLAARDTTAGLLSFVFFELARNPAIFKRLREEILETFGDGYDLSLINFESLKKCEYLKWVLNEALRMYPSVPLNFRVAQRDTTLPHGGGKDGMSPIFVREGTPVSYSVYSTQRDEDFFGKDAHVFRPERWGEPAAKKYGWAFVPFNGGPRICLGQQFALTEASYTVVRLLQLFKHLELYDSQYPPLKLTHLTMSLYNGCNVAMY